MLSFLGGLGSATLALAPAFASGEDESAEPSLCVEELFASELLRLQETGELQATFASRYANEPDGRRFEALLALEYGIDDDLQAELALPYERFDAVGEVESGAGALEIGLLRRLASTEELEWALALDASFPAFDRAMDDDGFGFGAELLALHTFDDGAWQASLGVERDEGGIGGELGAAFLHDFGALAGSLEARASLDSGDLDALVAPGVTWRAGGFELGCAVAIGVAGDEPDFQLLFQITREWATAREHRP